MTFLYTKDGCPGCDKARELLVSQDERYKEVLVDNPILEVGIKTLLKKDFVLTPLLVRTNGKSAKIFVPAKGSDGSFYFTKVI